MNCHPAAVQNECYEMLAIRSSNLSEMNVYIIRTGAHLPNQPVNNEQIEDVLGMIDGRPSRAKKIILKSNGIKQRYYVISQNTGEPTITNAQLTAEAVRGLFDDKETLNRLDCLVCGTTIADQLMPNHAVMVHGELQNPPCEVIATSGICMAGVAALKYGWLAIRSGEHQTAVATGSEVASPLLLAKNFAAESTGRLEALKAHPEIAFEKDFLRWMLSDGAGAFLLSNTPKHTKSPALRIDWIEIVSYANEVETCMYAGAEKLKDGELKGWKLYGPKELAEKSVLTIKQDVKLLNASIVPYAVTKTLQKVVEKYGIKAKQIDYFLPHISSMYFYEKVKNALIEIGFEIPLERWFTNLESTGNTGSASIYIMVDELVKSGSLKSGEKILCFIPESGRFSASYMLLTVV